MLILVICKTSTRISKADVPIDLDSSGGRWIFAGWEEKLTAQWPQDQIFSIGT